MIPLYHLIWIVNDKAVQALYTVAAQAPCCQAFTANPQATENHLGCMENTTESIALQLQDTRG